MAASTTSRVREWLRAGANGDAAFPTGSCVVSPAHAVAHEAGAARYLEPARCPAGQTEARVAAALVRPEHPARAAVAARRGVKADVLDEHAGPDRAAPAGFRTARHPAFVKGTAAVAFLPAFDHAVAAHRRRTRAVGSAEPRALVGVGSIALLAALIHKVVPAYGRGTRTVGLTG